MALINVETYLFSLPNLMLPTFSINFRSSLEEFTDHCLIQPPPVRLQCYALFQTEIHEN